MRYRCSGVEKHLRIEWHHRPINESVETVVQCIRDYIKNPQDVMEFQKGETFKTLLPDYCIVLYVIIPQTNLLIILLSCVFVFVLERAVTRLEHRKPPDHQIPLIIFLCALVNSLIVLGQAQCGRTLSTSISMRIPRNMYQNNKLYGVTQRSTRTNIQQYTRTEPDGLPVQLLRQHPRLPVSNH